MRPLLVFLLPFTLLLTACEALNIQPDEPDGPLVCSAGWTVTGYFTPVEADYDGATETVKVPGFGQYAAVRGFLREVEVQGWGKTNGGWYLAFYDGEWHRSATALGATGLPIETGQVAVDPRVVRLGSSLRIPSLPAPWDAQPFRARDVGTAVAGQHVDVYTGVGASARGEAFRLTTRGAEVCHNGG